MQFLIFLALVNVILAAPAHVLVVTKVRTLTVYQNGGSLTTATVDAPAVLPDFFTETKSAQVTTAPIPGPAPAQTTDLAPAPEPIATTELPPVAATTEAPIPVAPTTVPTTDAAPTSPTSTGSGSSPTGSFAGEGTYYDTGLGACGETNSDSDYIVAISHELFDSFDTTGNPNTNPVCGKKIKASFEGKSVDVTVVDRCEGCAKDDLDFSPSAFTQIADKGLGRIKIDWDWA